MQPQFYYLFIPDADASQAIFEPPPENWRQPQGWPRTTWMKNIHDDLSSLNLEIHKTRDLAQNRPLCRLMSLHRAMHSWWCMLLLDWIGIDAVPLSAVTLDFMPGRTSALYINLCP